MMDAMLAHDHNRKEHSGGSWTAHALVMFQPIEGILVDVYRSRPHLIVQVDTKCPAKCVCTL